MKDEVALFEADAAVAAGAGEVGGVEENAVADGTAVAATGEGAEGWQAVFGFVLGHDWNVKKTCYVSSIR